MKMKKSAEDSSEAVLTSRLEIDALKVSKMYLPAVCNISQICTLFNVFSLPKLVPATFFSFSKKLQYKRKKRLKKYAFTSYSQTNILSKPP